MRVTEDFPGFGPAIKACDVCWNKYYNILGISEALIKELTSKGRGARVDEMSICTVDMIYHKISSIVPTGELLFSLNW